MKRKQYIPTGISIGVMHLTLSAIPLPIFINEDRLAAELQFFSAQVTLCFFFFQTCHKKSRAIDASTEIILYHKIINCYLEEEINRNRIFWKIAHLERLVTKHDKCYYNLRQLRLLQITTTGYCNLR